MTANPVRRPLHRANDALRIGSGVAALTLIAGCASIRPVGVAPNLLADEPPGPTEINWPAQYDPDDATFYITNSIEVGAPPEVVWEVLTEAETWPAWYEGAFDVEVTGATDGVLRAGSEFSWRTMGLAFTSVVHEFEPPTRLAWESRRDSIKGYHAWLIVPTETGSRVVTDEAQLGFLAVMQRWFQPNKLRELHDVWLAELKARAEARAEALAEQRFGAGAAGASR